MMMHRSSTILWIGGSAKIPQIDGFSIAWLSCYQSESVCFVSAFLAMEGLTCSKALHSGVKEAKSWSISECGRSSVHGPVLWPSLRCSGSRTNATCQTYQILPNCFPTGQKKGAHNVDEFAGPNREVKDVPSGTTVHHLGPSVRAHGLVKLTSGDQTSPGDPLAVLGDLGCQIEAEAREEVTTQRRLCPWGR